MFQRGDIPPNEVKERVQIELFLVHLLSPQCNDVLLTSSVFTKSLWILARDIFWAIFK